MPVQWMSYMKGSLQLQEEGEEEREGRGHGGGGGRRESGGGGPGPCPDVLAWNRRRGKSDIRSCPVSTVNLLVRCRKIVPRLYPYLSYHLGYIFSCSYSTFPLLHCFMTVMA